MKTAHYIVEFYQRMRWLAGVFVCYVVLIASTGLLFGAVEVGDDVAEHGEITTVVAGGYEGDGRYHLWIVTGGKDGRFGVWHRPWDARDKNAVYAVIKDAKGLPIAAAANGTRLYFVYDRWKVRCVTYVAKHREGMTLHDSIQSPPLPLDAELISFTAGKKGAFALLTRSPQNADNVKTISAEKATEGFSKESTATPWQSDTNNTYSRYGESQNKASDLSNQNERRTGQWDWEVEGQTAGPAGEQVAGMLEGGVEGEYELLGLQANKWVDIDLPRDLHNRDDVQLVWVGGTVDMPILIARIDTGVVVYKAVLLSDIDTNINDAFDSKWSWHRTDYNVAINGRWKATCVLSRTTTKSSDMASGQVVLVTPSSGNDKLIVYALVGGEAVEQGYIILPAEKEFVNWTPALGGQLFMLATVYSDSNGGLYWDVRGFGDQVTNQNNTDGLIALEQLDWPHSSFDIGLWVLEIALILGIGLLLLTRKRDMRQFSVDLPSSVVLAGLGRRALAVFIDTMPGSLIACLIMGMPNLSVSASWATAPTDTNIIRTLIAMVIFISHCTLTEMFTSTTLGKLVTDCKVATTRGGTPDVWQVLARNTVKIIEMMAWLLLIFMVFSRYNQRLGDTFAGTVVVRRRSGEKR